MARIGIIGTGWGANVQVPAFRHAGLEVVALAGRDPAKTMARAEALGVSRAVARWEDLVELPEVDLVSIVAPPAEHRRMAEAALRAGKHVLCEKPTALSAAEAEAMVAVAEAHPDRLALIDHELRFLPAWTEARRRVTDLGPIHAVDTRSTGRSRADRSRRWNWWSDEAQGGGVLGAIGSHHLDTIRFLTGDRIVAVQAALHTAVDHRPDGAGRPTPVTSDDTALLHLRLGSGAVGTVSLLIAAPIDEPSSFTLHGERGSIRLTADRLQAAEAGGSWTDVALPELSVPTDLTGGEYGRGTVALGHALRRALDDGDRSALDPAATFADGLVQQQLLDAARASHRDGGRWVETPVAK